MSSSSAGHWKKPPTAVVAPRQHRLGTNVFNAVALNSISRSVGPTTRTLVTYKPDAETPGASTSHGATATTAKRQKHGQNHVANKPSLQDRVPRPLVSVSDKKGKAKATGPSPEDNVDIIDVDADPIIMSVDGPSSPGDPLQLKAGDKEPEAQDDSSNHPSRFFAPRNAPGPPRKSFDDDIEEVLPRDSANSLHGARQGNVIEKLNVFELLSESGIRHNHVDLKTKQKKKNTMKKNPVQLTMTSYDVLSAPTGVSVPKPAKMERKTLDMHPIEPAQRTNTVEKNVLSVSQAVYSLKKDVSDVVTPTHLFWSPATSTLRFKDHKSDWMFSFSLTDCKRIQVSMKNCQKRVVNFTFKPEANFKINQAVLTIPGQAGLPADGYLRFLDFLKDKEKHVEYLDQKATDTILQSGIVDVDEEEEPEPSITPRQPPQKEGSKRLQELRKAPPAPPRKRKLSQTDVEITTRPTKAKLSNDDVSKPTSGSFLSAPAPRRTRNRTREEQESLSSTTRTSAKRSRTPKGDPDEIILNYPSGAPGSVNLTNADLARLEPNEFLNDTVIEFGLKLWLKELERDNPDLASKIYVFNSFFYKKLNQKKEVAYDSVKKWTSKIDIFEKKYLIVPINENFHWYLAIIYEPEHILSPPPPSDPAPSRQTRQTPQKPPSTRHAKHTLPSISTTTPPPTTTTTTTTDLTLTTPNSEAEVEQELADFPNSCSIMDEVPTTDITMIDDDAPSDLSYVTDPNAPRRSRSLSASEMEPQFELLATPTPAPSKKPAPAAEVIPESDDDCMELDGPVTSASDALKPPSTSRRSSTTMTESNKEKSPPLEILSSQPQEIPASIFYGKATARSRMKGKQKAKPPISIAVEDLVENQSTESADEEPESTSNVPTTYIFTLDSLGSRHPQAVKKLTAYLQLEAEHKKGVKEAGKATGKLASVPAQPNFCDCGVYLLHFVETFMSNPQGFAQLITTRKPKGQSKAEYQRQWKEDAVKEKRAQLATRILELSEAWKQEKKAKEAESSTKAKEDQKGEDEDDEVMVIHETERPAAPKRGPANRLR